MLGSPWGAGRSRFVSRLQPPRRNSKGDSAQTTGKEILVSTTTTTAEPQEERITELLERLGVQFSRYDGMKAVRQQVEAHKYLLCAEHQARFDWQEAFVSWKVNVLIPVRDAVARPEGRWAFLRKPLGDLYLEVCDHWHFLKQDDPAIRAPEAAEDFALRFGSRIAGAIARNLVKPIAQLFAPRAMVPMSTIEESLVELGTDPDRDLPPRNRLDPDDMRDQQPRAG